MESTTVARGRRDADWKGRYAMFDMNSGYFGWSMSRNAVAAYDDGLKPKSKWSKAAMLNAIAEWCEENDRIPTADLSKLRKDELFGCCLEWREWHHTSKYCNPTDFYGLDEDALDGFTREMTAAELAERDRFRAERERAEQAAARKREAKAAAAREARAGYEKKHGFGPQTWLAFADSYPDAVGSRKSRRGNTVYTLDLDGAHFEGAPRSNLPIELRRHFDATTDDGRFFERLEWKKSEEE